MKNQKFIINYKLLFYFKKYILLISQIILLFIFILKT